MSISNLSPSPKTLQKFENFPIQPPIVPTSHRDWNIILLFNFPQFFLFFKYFLIEIVFFNLFVFFFYVFRVQPYRLFIVLALDFLTRVPRSLDNSLFEEPPQLKHNKKNCRHEMIIQTEPT